MNQRTLLLALGLLRGAATFAQPHPQGTPPPGAPQGERRPPREEMNPRVPTVHDPVMAIGEDGRQYLFSTGMGVQVLSSTDGQEWKREKSVLDGAPEWATQLVPGYRGHTWAPDIKRVGDMWYLYYSCSTFGKNQSAIGLAVNKTLDPSSPDFGWTDRGLVIKSERHRDCWNAIDPNLVITPEGKPYLTFGSFWDGIQLVELGEDLQTVVSPQPKTIARRHNHVYTIEEIDQPHLFEVEGTDTVEAADNAVEAPFIIQRDGWYYLFVSQDYCCRGQRSTYRVVYGRSRSVEGPYLDREGRPMTEGGGTLLYGPDETNYGIGHSAAYEIDGQWVFICHAYGKELNGRATLFRSTLHFDAEGWIE